MSSARGLFYEMEMQNIKENDWIMKIIVKNFKKLKKDIDIFKEMRYDIRVENRTDKYAGVVQW